MRRLAVVLLVAVLSVINFQHLCAQGWPGEGGVSVTPDGAKQSGSHGVQGSLVFSVKNTGTEWDAYDISCSHTGQVFTCAPPSSPIDLGPGAKVNVTVTYTGSVGVGTVTMKAESINIWENSPVENTGYYTVTVDGVDVPPSLSLANHNGDYQNRGMCLTLPAGGDATVRCGDLVLAHATPPYRTLGRDRAVTLVYNSATPKPRPAVAVTVTQPDSANSPLSVKAELRINDVIRASGTFAPWAAGGARQIVLAYDINTSTEPTGIYNFVVNVTNEYSGVSKTIPYADQLIVVNRYASDFGRGWHPAGVKRLVLNQPGSRILWVGGDGSAVAYTSAASNTWVAAPAAYRDTITWSAGEGLYTRHLLHGAHVKFDAAGRHVLTITRTSDTTTFTYGGAGRLTNITVPLAAGDFELAYTNGKLNWVKDPLGYMLDATVTSGRLVQLDDPDGSTVSFGYTNDRLTSRTNRRNYTTTYSYANGLRVTSVSQPLNASETAVATYTQWDEQGLAVNVVGGTLTAASSVFSRYDGPRTDSSDVVTFWIDRWGAPTTISDPYTKLTQLTRGDPNRPALVTRLQYPSGQVLGAWYNALGLPDSTVDSSLVVGGVRALTRYVYDPVWAVPTRVISPEGDSVVSAYDPANGNRLWQQDARGSSSRVNFTYWRDLVRTVTPPLSPAESLSYDVRGNLSRTRTPLGFVTAYVNDVRGFPWQVTSYEGVVAKTSRDHRNARDTLTTTYGPQRSQSDPVYNMTWNARTAYLRKEYDAEGNLIETGRWSSIGTIGTIVETTRYDRANRPVAVVAADGVKDSVVYDRAGNQIRLLTRRGQTIEQAFNRANRLSQRRTPTVSYGYTVFEQWPFLSQSIPGDTTRFFYDTMGRDTLAVNRFSRVSRIFGTHGLLLSEIQQIRSWAERANSTWNTSGFSTHVYGLSYTYDLNGRRTRLTHPTVLGPGNDHTDYTYRNTGQLKTIKDPYGKTFWLYYDLEGRLDSLKYPTTAVIGEKWRYDPDGRVRYHTIRAAAAASGYPNNVVRADTIVYDGDSRVVSVRNAGRTLQEYWYTGLGQTGLSVEAYWNGSSWTWSRKEFFQPDALGNMYWRSSAMGAGDPPRDSVKYHATTGRVTSRGDLNGGSWDWTPTVHDAAGNVLHTSRIERGAQCYVGNAFLCQQYLPARYSAVTGYHYDADQRLVSSRRYTTLPEPNEEQVGGWEEYWYDPYGRRILRKWQSDMIIDPGGEYNQPHMYRYVWDGQQILYEIRTEASDSSVDALVSSNEFGWVGYVHGPGIDNPLEVFRADGYPVFDRIFLHADWRGSITLGSRPDGTKDRESGPNLQMIDWRRFNVSTYGERQTPFTHTNRLYYGTLLERQQDGSKLQYMRNRYYDPVTGRFTQEDPIGLAGGLNLYGFANGDPVNFSDPFGLNPCLAFPQACLAAAGFVVGAAGQIASNLLNGRAWHEDAGSSGLKWAAAGATLGATALASGGSAAAAQPVRYVIGAMEDLGASGGIKAGEATLLPRLVGDLGRAANWARNEGVLREVMELGRPIRDASVGLLGGLKNFGPERFITLERQVLQRAGWTYSRWSQSWNPPDN